MRRLLILLSIPWLSCAPERRGLPEGEWIDLTHPFSEDAVYWPTGRTFEKTTVFEGRTDAGYYYTAYEFCAAEHGGTHIDAPIHFAENRNTLDQIPLEQLIGPAVVIRIVDEASERRNYQLSTGDLLAWEQEHGRIPDDSIVLVDTGSSRLWPDRRAYMGTDERGEAAVAKLAFPGIHPDAARFLVDERRIKAVGLDTPSIDHGPSTRFESHRIFYENDVPGLENVANLDRLPDRGAIVFALPMKIRGGSGGPVRIAALIPSR